MESVVIASRKNELVKHAARLASSAAFRRDQKAFLAEGARLCRDAAESGVPLQSVFFTALAREKYAPYLERILERAEKAYLVEPHVAELLSETKQPQGVFCVCAMGTLEKRPEEMKPDGRYVALENLQDPSNLGAVLRTAEALGIAGVFLSGTCCDLYGPKVLRSSMGAVFRLPFCFLPELSEGVRLLSRAGFRVLAAVPARDAAPVTELSFPNGTVMAIGNEGSGLSDDAVAACAQRITIPMRGRAESLNAASSAAILMWEMMRAQGE